MTNESSKMFYPKAMEIVFRTMSSVLPPAQRNDPAPSGGGGGGGSAKSMVEREENISADEINVSTQTDGEDYVELLRLAYERIRGLEGQVEQLQEYTNNLRDQVRVLRSENQALINDREGFRIVANDANNEQLEKIKVLFETNIFEKFALILEQMLNNENKTTELQQMQREQSEYLQKSVGTEIPGRFKALEDQIARKDVILKNIIDSIKAVTNNVSQVKDGTGEILNGQHLLNSRFESAIQTIQRCSETLCDEQVRITGSLDTLSEDMKKKIEHFGGTLRIILSRTKDNGELSKSISQSLTAGSAAINELGVGIGETKKMAEEFLQQQKEQSVKINNIVQQIGNIEAQNERWINWINREAAQTTSKGVEEIVIDTDEEDIDTEQNVIDEDVLNENNNNNEEIGERKRKVGGPIVDRTQPKRMKRRSDDRQSTENVTAQEENTFENEFICNCHGLPLPSRSTMSDQHPYQVISSGFDDETCRSLFLRSSTQPNQPQVNIRSRDNSRYTLRNTRKVSYTV